MGQNNFGVFSSGAAGGGGGTTRTALPSSSFSSTASAGTSKPTAFKPLRPVSNPASSSSKPFVPPKYLAPRPQPNGIPSLPPIVPSQREQDGPPEIVETRASMIHQAVLVNPKLEKPKFNPSTQRDLLSSFQSNEMKLLDELKGLGGEGKGKEREELDLTLSSDDPPLITMEGGASGVRRPPMSPKRPAKKTKK